MPLEIDIRGPPIWKTGAMTVLLGGLPMNAWWANWFPAQAEQVLQVGDLGNAVLRCQGHSALGPPMCCVVVECTFKYVSPVYTPYVRTWD